MKETIIIKSNKSILSCLRAYNAHAILSPQAKYKKKSTKNAKNILGETSVDMLFKKKKTL